MSVPSIRVAPALPDAFDGFRVLQRIGAGAMGTVYLAQDTELDRPVAIKVLTEPYPDAVSKERFVVEARAIARVQHPNVVSVFRSGEIGGRPYLVSEFVKGRSLAQLERPLSREELLSVALGLSKGLADAHRRGVLHRDIKPANALLSDEGVAKLCDFGVARLMESFPVQPVPDHAATPKRGAAADATMSLAPPNEAPRTAPRASSPMVALTADGGRVGTPRYMAPEVWSGRPASVQSDLYSLGALLYELCAGVAPHPQDDLAALERAVHEEPVLSLAMLAPGTDPRLATLIDQCLRKDPSQRPASAEVLVEAISRLVAQSASLPPGSPFRGLDIFGPEHRGVFFGRNEDADAVLAMLRATSFVVVAGESGVGKSSLCRAGVFPAITAGALGEGRTWAVHPFAPGRRPYAGVLDAIGRFVPNAAPGRWQALAPDAAALGDLFGRTPERGLVLYVDALEELVTQSDPEEAKAFARMLVVVSGRVPGLRVLATARADFLGKLAAVGELSSVLGGGLYFLRPLSPQSRREIIEAPVHALGFRYERAEMVDALAAEEAGPLPLLQFALTELWERRDVARRIIPASALEAVGGVSGALTRHADAVMQRLRGEERTAARELLLRLVSPERLRLRKTEHELIAAGEASSRRALTALVQGRLVTARESAADPAAGEYEIAHEALIREWGTLGDWLEGARERQLAFERLGRATAEWKRLAESAELLWSAQQLAEFAAVGVADDGALTVDERAFLGASRRQLARRRRRLVWAAGLVVCFAGAGWGALHWKMQRDLAVVVGRQLEPARLAHSRARDLVARGEAQRMRAEALFAQARTEEAESAWTASVQLASSADAQFAEAARGLEAALQLDPRRSDTRALFAEVLYDRALLAERRNRSDDARELVGRLPSFGAEDALARWEAPSELEIRSDPPGAQVALARMEAQEGRRIPSPEKVVGTTPLRLTLRPGSYLLTLRVAGRPDVRYPLTSARGERRTLDVPIPRHVPDGFVYVPPGRFLFGSADDETARKTLFGTQPQRAVSTDGFFISRHEVTFAEWIAFLEALPPAERRARLPRAKGFHGELSLEGAGTQWLLALRPTVDTHRVRSGERVQYRGRTRRASQDWLRFPVTAISWEDALAYARWLDSSGRVPGARLCNEYEWERAARGADDRLYPSGDVLGEDDANLDVTYGRTPEAFGPDEVGSHPGSVSVFGVEDLAGNVWEWTRSVTGDQVVYRGGGWYEGRLSSRSNNRQVGERSMRDLVVGVRVCADVNHGGSSR